MSHHKTRIRDDIEAARSMGFEESVRSEIGFDVDKV
jgi:hypothetical protein